MVLPKVPGRRRFAFGSRQLTVSRAGRATVTVSPSRSARRLVGRHRRQITLRLWVAYTPTGGAQRITSIDDVSVPAAKAPQR